MSSITIGQALHLAMQHHHAGRLKEAETIYRQVLTADPNHADALHLLGVIAHQCNHHAPAVELIQKSLAVHPNNAGAQNNLGEAYRSLGQNDEAIAAYKRSLEIDPRSTEALGNLGLVYFNVGRVDEAIEQYHKALAINPKMAQTLSNLGNAMLHKKELDRAMAAYDAAVAADPMLADAHNNRGSALEHLDRLDEAYDEYRRATEINPRFPIACNNAANAARRLSRWEEARMWCEKALALDPNYEPARWNQGLIELTMGYYAIGLPKYELRFVATPQRLPKDLFGLRWDGSPLDGKTVLLVGEQGLGDTWQAARYVPMIRERGGKVLIECTRSQVSMLGRLPGVEQAFANHTPRPSFDCFAPMMSLPLLFNTTITTIENRVPYLTAEPARVESWRERLSFYGSGPKVGLVWHGSALPEPLRSCKLTDLAPLGRALGIKFFSLQVGEGSEEAANPPAELNLTDLAKDVWDFEEMAACMMNLDLIISIDTAAAHLAGAL
ncbi:MAG: glycosyltransferase family protein, partial [Phycisphaerae bacterium]|nr:glycosyltransferase family protein [Phycisphaerae bacterium]